MPRPTVCPHCGKALSEDPPSPLGEIPNHTIEVELPPATRPEYHDDTASFLPHFAGQANLDEQGPGFPPPDTEPAPAFPAAFEEPTPGPATMSSQMDDHNVRVAFNDSLIPVSLGPGESLAGETPAGQANRTGTDRSPRWPMILLASYASAVTLGMLFLIMQTRRNETAEYDSGRAASHDSRPEQHSPSKLASWIARLAPLADSSILTLGENRVLGDLEITPLQVELAPVTLIRVAGESGETKEGGEDALHLTLEIKNRSETRMIQPLEMADLRERDRGASPSVIITSPETVIRNYPLARESEWSIAGQDSPSLQPGQSAVIRLVSEPAVRDRCSPRMLWRLPLRLTPDQTEWIGIAFAPPEMP